LRQRPGWEATGDWIDARVDGRGRFTILSIPDASTDDQNDAVGVSMASDSSRSSSVVGLSDTSAIRWMPGAIWDVFSISSI